MGTSFLIADREGVHLPVILFCLFVNLSEKWLSPAPVPQVELWKNRELEILGWSDYLTQLVSWSAQGSELFSNEISQAAKWPSAIGMEHVVKGSEVTKYQIACHS